MCSISLHVITALALAHVAAVNWGLSAYSVNV